MHLNFLIYQLQWFYFDSASNMCGHLTGPQGKQRVQSPHVLYVHCSNRVLDLVLQDVSREVCLFADALNFVQGISAALGEPPKQNTLLFSFVVDEVVCLLTYNLLPLCPTRWSPWQPLLKAINRVCSSYVVLLKTLKTLEKDKTLRADAKREISGLYWQAVKARTCFGLVSCKAVFELCEAVAKALQHKQASARGAIGCIGALRIPIDAMRTDEFVEEMITKVNTCIAWNNLHIWSTTMQKSSSSSAGYTDTCGHPTAFQLSTVETWFVSSSRPPALTPKLGRRFNQLGMK